MAVLGCVIGAFLGLLITEGILNIKDGHIKRGITKILIGIVPNVYCLTRLIIKIVEHYS